MSIITAATPFDDQLEEVYRISGAIGENKAHCDGFYLQQPTSESGRPRFYRQTFGADEDPMVLWYYTKRRCWMLSHRSQVDTDTARAIVKQDVEHPEDITETWFVFDPVKANFDRCPTFAFFHATDTERKTVRQQFITIEGRKGYNRAMNGRYKRGDRLHAGKSWYGHVNNDFKIRWYETKWVIDWRRGLKNDNVGAAVVKEDTPEPWMVTIPWRIYDGKAKTSKKWVYDRLVTVRVRNVEDLDDDFGANQTY